MRGTKVFVLVSVLLITVVALSTGAAYGERKRYTNARLGISIEPPVGWAMKEGTAAVHFVKDLDNLEMSPRISVRRVGIGNFPLISDSVAYLDAVTKQEEALLPAYEVIKQPSEVVINGKRWATVTSETLTPNRPTSGGRTYRKVRFSTYACCLKDGEMLTILFQAPSDSYALEGPVFRQASESLVVE